MVRDNTRSFPMPRLTLFRREMSSFLGRVDEGTVLKGLAIRPRVGCTLVQGPLAEQPRLHYVGKVLEQACRCHEGTGSAVKYETR